MFYDNFLLACKEKNVSPSKAGQDCGISKATVSHWKTRGYTPRNDVIVKLSEYFGVSVDFLLGNEKKTAQTDGLTDDEQTLIDCYRSMDDAERTAFISFLQSRSNKK